MSCAPNWFQSFTAYMDQPHSNHWLWLFIALVVVATLISPGSRSRHDNHR